MKAAFRAALVVLAKGLMSRRVRWAFPIAALGTSATVLAFGVLKPSPPKEKLSAKDVRTIYAALLTHVEKGGPNHMHSRSLGCDVTLTHARQWWRRPGRHQCRA